MSRAIYVMNTKSNGFLLVMLLTLSHGLGLAGDDQSERDRRIEAARRLEAAMDEGSPLFTMDRWDSEVLRELSRAIPSYNDTVAGYTLWLATTAPNSINTSPIYVQALSSPSLAIRDQAAQILAAEGSRDSMRLLFAKLVGRPDADTVKAIVSAIARQPRKIAVNHLIDVILDSSTSEEAVAAVAVEMQRLTNAEIPAYRQAWKDWWLDNAHLYDH